MKGTVFLAENFCPDNAAKLLWKAIDGLGNFNFTRTFNYLLSFNIF